MCPGNGEPQPHPGGTQQLSGQRSGVTVDDEIDEAVRGKQFVEFGLLATDGFWARGHERCTSDVVNVVTDAHVEDVARVEDMSGTQTILGHDSLDRYVVDTRCDLGEKITGEHSNDTRVANVFWLGGRRRGCGGRYGSYYGGCWGNRYGGCWGGSR